MCEIVIFGGTTEGRMLAEFLSRQRVETHVCAATAYGGSLLPQAEGIAVSAIPLSREEMERMLEKKKPRLVIDATHPYASSVTENIKSACQTEAIPYIRLLRADEKENSSPVITVNSIEDAVAYLQHTEGKILAATGSKELEAYTKLPDYRQRVIARVLSTKEAVAQCVSLGFEGKNLICMQGPFSAALNQAIIEQYQCKYLVTKASGSPGGYEEKIRAALACGCQAVVIGRPVKENGFSYFQCKKKICRELHIQPKRQITLVGIGPGNPEFMTRQGEKAVREAEVLIGAERMVEAVRNPGQEVYYAYDGEKIRQWLEEQEEYEKIAIVLSGDTGFYSGAKKISQALKKAGWNCRYSPGVSSVAYMASKLGINWDEIFLLSVHGKESPILSVLRDHPKVMALMGKKDGVRTIACQLKEYGMEQVILTVGERLSYEQEKITRGRAERFLAYENDPLCVLLLENPMFFQTRQNPFISRKDQDFIRGNVPMTKEEIRVLSLDKLQLSEESVCYDIGAGTGSVSAEMAIRARRGKVYAIEKNPEAIKLLQANQKKFLLEQMEIIEGAAPDILKDLPAPTHVFIGGTSGNMKEILQTVFDKNPAARVVINCIAMQSCAEALRLVQMFSDGEEEILQVFVSKGHKVGSYTMMKGENPITIFAFTGKGEGE